MVENTEEETVVDPATIAMLATAVTPALSSMFGAATTAHGQRVDLRKTQLSLENQRAMQWEDWEQRRAAQHENWEQQRAALFEDWQQRRLAQLEAWRQRHKLARLSFEHERQQQEQAWRHQRQMAREAHEQAIQRIELAHVLDDWPLTVQPSQVIQFDKSFDGAPPLTILIAPPHRRRLPAGWNPAWIEPKLSKGLSDFLGRYFPFHEGSPRPVHVLGGAWKPDGLRQQAAIVALFSMLKGHPTVILDAEVIGNQVHLGLGVWNNGEVYTYQPVHVFPIGDRSAEAVTDDILLCQRFLGLAAADLYFLSTAALPPQLPRAVPALLDTAARSEAMAMVDQIVFLYRDVYERLIAGREASRPEIELELAESLAGLPDKTLAVEEMHASMHAWLALRGVRAAPEGDLYTTLLIHRKPKQDRNYFERLDRVRHAIVSLG